MWGLGLEVWEEGQQEHRHLLMFLLPKAVCPSGEAGDITPSPIPFPLKSDREVAEVDNGMLPRMLSSASPNLVSSFQGTLSWFSSFLVQIRRPWRENEQNNEAKISEAELGCHSKS